MTTKGSKELEQDITRLEQERAQAIVAEHRESEAALERQNQAEAARVRTKEETTRRRIALAERKRAEGIQRDLDWPATVRETCFVEAINPLFKSWNLCQPFLDGQRQDAFCGQCSCGYENEFFKAGYVHREKAREPC